MSSSQSSPGYYNTLPSTSTTIANVAATCFVFTTCHPWRELVQPFSSFTCPYTLKEASSCVKCNLNHFRVNYTFIALLILFLSLLWHQISMIVFIVWSFLYFLRDRPLLLFHITVDNRIILALLSIITIIALVLIDVWLNVFDSLTLG